ncbi:predicted protein [Brucella sp. 83/13]|nr:predicted protein [Brucella sp. 83/13]
MTGRHRKSVTQRLKTDALNPRSFSLEAVSANGQPTLRSATAIPDFNFKSISACHG